MSYEVTFLVRCEIPTNLTGTCFYLSLHLSVSVVGPKGGFTLGLGSKKLGVLFTP